MLNNEIRHNPKIIKIQKHRIRLNPQIINKIKKTKITILDLNPTKIRINKNKKNPRFQHPNLKIKNNKIITLIKSKIRENKRK